MQQEKLEIENEYDNRYEGFDYDDVDERGRELDFSSDEDNPSSQPANLQLPLVGDLEKAEELHESAEAQTNKSVHKRIQDHLENNTPSSSKPSNSLSISATQLLKYHSKIFTAISDTAPNLVLDSSPTSLASTIILSIARDDTMKSIVQNKLAFIMRRISNDENLKTEKNILNLLLEASSSKGTLDHNKQGFTSCLSLTLESSLNAKMQDDVDEIKSVRGLLQLSTFIVSQHMLVETNAGKNIRKLKRHTLANIRKAAWITTDAWKECIISKTKK